MNARPLARTVAGLMCAGLTAALAAPARDINVCKKEEGVVYTDAVCAEGEWVRKEQQRKPEPVAPVELPPMGSGGSNFCTDPVFGEILRRSERVKQWLGALAQDGKPLPAALPPQLIEDTGFQTPTQPPLDVTLLAYASTPRQAEFQLGVSSGGSSVGRLHWSAPLGEPVLSWSCTSSLPRNYLTTTCTCP